MYRADHPSDGRLSRREIRSASRLLSSLGLDKEGLAPADVPRSYQVALGLYQASFNRTGGHLVSTMLAHLSFNMSLVVRGAILGSVFIWTLASIFSIVAIFSLAKLSARPISRIGTCEVFTPFGTDHIEHRNRPQ